MNSNPSPNLLIIAAFLRAIADGHHLLQLWRAWGMIRDAEKVTDFRAGIIQFAKALELCYTNEYE